MNWAKHRRKVAATGAANLIVAGVLLILINVLAHWFFLRWDMTHNHAFSLSPSSRTLVRNLEDRVVVKAYFSSGLPYPYNNFESYTKDLLTEYATASHGRLKAEFIPPDDAHFEQHANEAGLQPVQFEEMGSNQMALRRGYMGLVLYYRDKSQSISVVKDVQNLEYELTSRIARMVNKNKKVIGLSQGHGETVLLGPGSKVIEALKDLYDLKVIDLPAGATAQMPIDALLIVGPQQKMDAASAHYIDGLITNGTPVAFFVDSYKIDMSGFYASHIDSGLADLLDHYGVRVSSRMVVDAQSEIVGMTQNVSGLALTTRVRYPFIPLIGSLPSDQSLLMGIEAVAVPFTTTIDASALPSGVRFTRILQTSPRSWLAPLNLFNLSPTGIPQPDPTNAFGPYTVAATVTGNFGPSGKANTLFVMGTSQLLNPQLEEVRGGAAFLNNLMATLTRQEALIGIRSKNQIIRPLRLPTPLAVQAVKWSCIVLIPGLAALCGLWRWQRRQVWRGKIAASVRPITPIPE